MDLQLAKEAVINALRDRARKFVSLDAPEDADLGDIAIDIGAGFVPGVGQAQAGRDFERARREGDRLGMVLSAAGMVPVVGGVANAANKVRKGAKAGEETVKALRVGPRAEALEVARQNAVKMLGLPENNTAMDRARALGFERGAYHGTNTEFQVPTRDVFASEAPSIANRYAFKASDDDSIVMPLLVRSGTPTFEHLGANSYRLAPKDIRSRFAAFDPARVKENDLLGRADPRLLAGIAAGGLGTAAAVAALRNRKQEEEEATR